MVTNPHLVRYLLLSVSIQNQFWIDTDSLILIDFAMVSDDELEALETKYIEWAANYFEEKTTERIFVGGDYFDTHSTIDLNDGAFIPLSQQVNTSISPTQWYARFYNNSPSHLPPGSTGVLSAIYISTEPDISYIGGYLPPYITSITVQKCALTQFNFPSIPATCLYLDLQQNALTDVEIDNILGMIDQNGAQNGTVDITGNIGAASAQGIIAALNLMAKGWTVNMD
jgi:hypothetical protein